jgi:hypothetical protein
MGHQSAPVGNPVAAVVSSPPVLVKPVAFTSPTVQAPAPIPSPTPLAKADPPAKTAQPDTKRRVEAVLTTAAIAAIIIQSSRDQYHAGGRPCACDSFIDMDCDTALPAFGDGRKGHS